MAERVNHRIGDGCRCADSPTFADTFDPKRIALCRNRVLEQAEARDIISSEPVFPASAAALDAVETRLGRSAVETARAERRLVEHLTDRELSILRALPGSLTQREIGRELYLSINTVKGYTKSLYRKLGVTSRTEAVERARDLGLI